MSYHPDDYSDFCDDVELPPIGAYENDRDWIREKFGPGPTEPEESQPPLPLNVRSFADFAGKDVPKHKFLVPELSMFPRGKVSLFSGTGGTGKSTIVAIQFSIARAAKRQWLNTDVAPGRTLYLSCEDDDDDVHIRADRVARHMGIDLENLDGCEFVDLVGVDTELATYDSRRGRMVPTRLYQQLEAQLATGSVDGLVLDSASYLFAGNDLDKVHVRQFMDLLARLARRYNVAIILLFHPSKSGLESGSGKSGSEAWYNHARHMVYFQTAPKTDGEIQDDDLRLMTVVKNNFGPFGQFLRCRNASGVFVREGEKSVASEQFKIDCLLVKLIDEHARERHAKYSPKPGRNFAAKAISEDPEAKAAGYTKEVLKSSLERLLKERVLLVDEWGPNSRRRQYVTANRDNGRALAMLAAQKSEAPI